MKVKRVLLLVCVFSLGWVNVASAEKTQAVTVEDYLGRPVSLAKPAERIVALAPHIVENLFSAGAGSRIVAAVDYSDFPEQAKAIPRVGGYSNFSLESIIAFSPDLVVTWASGNGAFGGVIEQLEALGIAVYIDDPHKLDDVARSIRDFGRLVGQSRTADVAATHYFAELAALRERYSERPNVSTFYQIWYEPLQTLNGDHIISDVIRLCGGSNSFDDAVVLAPKVSIESVLARDPRVIIASGMDDAGNHWLEKWQEWRGLTAVQHAQLYSVEPDLLHRHTQRILQGAKTVCEHLDKARNRYGLK